MTCEDCHDPVQDAVNAILSKKALSKIVCNDCLKKHTVANEKWFRVIKVLHTATEKQITNDLGRLLEWTG